MEKLDYKKQYKNLYSSKPGKVEEVTVPKLRYLMVDGIGDPNGQEFQDAVGALYSASYTLKFSRKKAGLEPDYRVGALEGLWWMEGKVRWDVNARQDWMWTAMILQPDFVSEEDLAETIRQLKIKKPSPSLDKLKLDYLDEGQSLQIMHVGPYSEERRSIDAMDAYAVEHGLRMHGKHHEIYMGDPWRTKPERLKTILRHPVSA